MWGDWSPIPSVDAPIIRGNVLYLYVNVPVCDRTMPRMWLLAWALLLTAPWLGCGGPCSVERSLSLCVMLQPKKSDWFYFCFQEELMRQIDDFIKHVSIFWYDWCGKEQSCTTCVLLSWTGMWLALCYRQMWLLLCFVSGCYATNVSTNCNGCLMVMYIVEGTVASLVGINFG